MERKVKFVLEAIVDADRIDEFKKAISDALEEIGFPWEAGEEYHWKILKRWRIKAKS